MEGYLLTNDLEISIRNLTRAFKVLALEEKVTVREVPRPAPPPRVVYIPSGAAMPRPIPANAAEPETEPIPAAASGIIYEKRELSRNDISTMSPDELGWHIENNFENYKKAISSPIAKAQENEKVS